jgi:uncharacterized protein
MAAGIACVGTRNDDPVRPTSADGDEPGWASDPPSERVRVRRLPDRGAYERAIIDAILDEARLCHLGIVQDGQPFVIPTLFGRDGDVLYVHGSAASRTLRLGAGGVPVCVTVTLLDGLVLARSAFHHSANYRSVVVLGQATPVRDEALRLHALETISEHILPGRWEEVRPPTRSELKATTVLAVPLDEASAKIRTGPPLDDDNDYDLDVWAGVVPLRTVVGSPEADERLRPGLAAPDVSGWPVRR